MRDIADLHRTEYSAEPEAVVSAPGVVHLMGEHTESSQGFSLSLALGRRLHIAVSRRKDAGLRFFSADQNERKRTSVANLKFKREDRWANYLKGVLFALQEEGIEIVGLNVTLYGDIPHSIGLGASAALTVAAATAFHSVLGGSLHRWDLVRCAHDAEAEFMGVRAGFVSHFAAASAQAGRLMLIDTRTRMVEHLAFPDDGVVLKVTNSRVPQHNPAGEYRSREEDCTQCVSVLSAKRQGISLRDFSSQDVRDSLGTMSEGVRRRCMHIVDEIQRVHESVMAVRSRQWPVLGKAMVKSHESLRDLYEVSCPELDWLVKRSVEIDGVLGARLTGTGFGGCTVTFLKREALAEYQKRLEEYERIFGFKPEILDCAPSDGLRVTT